MKRINISEKVNIVEMEKVVYGEKDVKEDEIN